MTEYTNNNEAKADAILEGKQYFPSIETYRENSFELGYNTAIRDFVGRLHFELLESVGTNKKEMEFAVRVIDMVAGQLKK